jgi:hypothetical protein
MVLLEAQACGKPVVAGNSGGTAETMQIPETGRVVSCYSPGKLAAVVVELLRDPDLRAQMGTQAREWVVEYFDWSVLTCEAEELFQGSSADCEMIECGELMGCLDAFADAWRVDRRSALRGTRQRRQIQFQGYGLFRRN